MSRTQRLVFASIVSLLGVLILLFVTILVRSPEVRKTTAVRPHATLAIPTTTSSPQQFTITPQQGWLAATTHLAFTQDLTFAQSNPFIGYACGVAKNLIPAPLQLSITTDSGRIWSSQFRQH